MRKLTYALLAAALAVTVLAGCSRKAEAEGSTQQATSAAQEKPVKADKEKETKAEDTASAETKAESGTEAETQPTELATGRHHVKIEVKDYGTISVELYADEAPISVTNFLKLAGEGFYDGLTFHRIITGFMIQGGDPLGTGMGGSDQMIKGEFAATAMEPREFTAVCKITLPMAVMEYCRPMGMPMPQRLFM